MLLTFLLDSKELFLYTPMLINIGLLAVFAQSVVAPPSIVEMFARIYVREMDRVHRDYCRNVTKLWCSVFFINAIISFFTTSDLGWWALYNGLISYVLIAAVFTAEIFYRYWRYRIYVGGPFEGFFRRIFPPLD